MERPTREEILTRTVKLIHDFVPELQDAELTEESTINTDAAMDYSGAFASAQFIKYIAGQNLMLSSCGIFF